MLPLQLKFMVIIKCVGLPIYIYYNYIHCFIMNNNKAFVMNNTIKYKKSTKNFTNYHTHHTFHKWHKCEIHIKPNENFTTNI